jgi:hypothetical protein
VATFDDAILVSSDDFPETTPNFISHDRTTDLPGGDETELETVRSSSREHGKDQIAPGKGLPLSSELREFTRAFDPKGRGKAHENARRSATCPRRGCGA